MHDEADEDLLPFLCGECTQLWVSSVAGEQCWQLHTLNTGDTLRKIVGGMQPTHFSQGPHEYSHLSV